jgi:hypothetical protein
MIFFEKKASSHCKSDRVMRIFLIFLFIFFLNCDSSNSGSPDTTAPSGGFSINNNALYTDTTAVTLNMSVSDAIEMRFSNDGSSWSGWESYTATKSWSIETGHSGKTVYGEFRDDAGNVFSTSDTVTPLFQEKLFASDGSDDDYFGGYPTSSGHVLQGSPLAVNSDGSVIVVGAMESNGNQGGAYVYRLNGSTWDEYILSFTPSGSSNKFGISVDVSSDGNTVVVGAWAYQANGAVFIYKWDTASYTESQVLKATTGYDRLGLSVSISSDASTILSGAYNSYATYSGQGAAYIYSLTSGNYGIQDGSNWVENQKIVTNDGDGSERGFGLHTALSGNGEVAIVMWPRIDNYKGAVYIYKNNNGTYGSSDGTYWVEDQKLLSSDRAENDYFGIQAAVSHTGDIIVVGAREDEVDGNSDQGSAYIFNLNTATGNYGEWDDTDSQWYENNKLTAQTGAGADNKYGFSVSMSGDGERIAVGSLYDDIDFTDQGSIYLYDWNGVGWDETRITLADGSEYDYFGYSVSLSADGHTIVAGAPGDDISTGSNQGAIYIY